MYVSKMKKNKDVSKNTKTTMNADIESMYHRALRMHFSKKVENQGIHKYDASDWRNIKVLDRSMNAIVESLQISNCHLKLWSTDITIGDSQTFSVAVDTAHPTIWVPSAKCDETCADRESTNYYDESISKSYQKYSDDKEKNEYLNQNMKGELGVDLIQVGDYMPHEELFAQITSIDNKIADEISDMNNDIYGYRFKYGIDPLQMCENIDGVLGLNLHDNDNPNLRPPVYNLLGDLEFPLFSLYFDPLGELKQQGIEIKTGAELILGGVHQAHYIGCLNWHASGSNVKEEDQTGFWDFALQDVVVGDKSMTKKTSMAILDSASSNIIGPTEIVKEFATVNGFECHQFNDDGSLGKKVKCDSNFFDAMTVTCNPEKPDEDNFQPLRFIADDIEYVLNVYDMSEFLFDEETKKTTCRPRLVASNVVPMWILGNPFLTKYYSAYDVNRMSIGLAEATLFDDSICNDDLIISIPDDVLENTINPEEFDDDQVDDDADDDDDDADNDDDDDADDDDDDADDDDADDKNDDVIELENDADKVEDLKSQLPGPGDDDALAESGLESDSPFFQVSDFKSEVSANLSSIAILGTIAAVIAFVLIRRKRRATRAKNNFLHNELGAMTDSNAEESDVGLFKIDEDLELM